MKFTWIRSGTLLLILLATLAAAWWAPDPGRDESVVEATQRVALAKSAVDARMRMPVSSASSHLSEPEVLQIRPRSDGEAADAWAALFAMPPAPIPSAPPPPPKIVAQPVMPAPPVAPVVTIEAPPPPALPFKVLGRYQDAKQTAVFLQDADQSWVAHVGDTIAQDYKVEAIEGQTLRLRHVPSNAVQTLDLGAVVDEVANPAVQQPPPAS
jgi:hypothetical protein